MEELKKEEEKEIVEFEPLEETKTEEKSEEKPIMKQDKKEKPVKKKIRRAKTVYDITGIISSMVIGVFLFLIFETYLYWGDPAFYIIVLLIGMCSWLVIGIPLGAFIVDTYLRCKLLRFINRRKNYGIIHIVSKGHRIITMIKDLNEAIIMKEDAIWGISKGYVYNLNKRNIKYPITDSMIHYISNVPVIYLDYESMKPLSFYAEETTISPKQLGSSLVGWAMVQKKKAIRQQKHINYMYLIISVLIVLNMILTYMILNKLGGI